MTRPSAAVAAALLVVLTACTLSGAGGQDGQGQRTATSGQPATGARTTARAVWSSGPQAKAHQRGDSDAVLVEIRAARQDGYDRVVFEFKGGLPGYQARYVAQPASAGDLIELDGTAFLLLAFDGASAGPDGFAQQDLHPRFRSVKQVRLVDQGGGRVRLVIGVDAVAGYLAHELTGPDRVIVDVAA